MAAEGIDPVALKAMLKQINEQGGTIDAQKEAYKNLLSAYARLSEIVAPGEKRSLYRVGNLVPHSDWKYQVFVLNEPGIKGLTKFLNDAHVRPDGIKCGFGINTDNHVANVSCFVRQGDNAPIVYHFTAIPGGGGGQWVLDFINERLKRDDTEFIPLGWGYGSTNMYLLQANLETSSTAPSANL